jgi:peptidoglycan hydrolase CwlO-like protein
MMTKTDLLALKDQVTDAKSNVASMKGKLEYLMSQLKETHSCNTIEEAESKIKKYDARIKKLDEQIQKATQELEEKYDLTEN